VTFRVYAPKATDVTVSGEFEVGAPAHKMVKDAQGVWSVTVGPFEPENYEYDFTVDGVQMLDPRNPAVKYNRGPAAISSLLDVRYTPRFFDVKACAARQGRHTVLRLEDDGTDAPGSHLYAAKLRQAVPPPRAVPAAWRRR